jgi:ubiquinone/menaquinone biosynthesis C-methylase UbiE
LDLGSGLGVDSFIAAARTGDSGKVTGLDLSKSEVLHANKRA